MKECKCNALQPLCNHYRDGLAEVNLLLSVAIYVFVYELWGSKLDFGQ